MSSPSTAPLRSADEPPSLDTLTLADVHESSGSGSSMASSPEDLVRRYSADLFAFTSKRLEQWKAEAKSEHGDRTASASKRTTSPARTSHSSHSTTGAAAVDKATSPNSPPPRK